MSSYPITLVDLEHGAVVIGSGTIATRKVRGLLDAGARVTVIAPEFARELDLDIIAQARARFDLPLVAYNVSGEYAMVKAAAANGWIDEPRIVLEILTAIKRAGADLIITYHAPEFAQWTVNSQQ